MRQMALFNTPYKVLLIASLMSSCLLMGCASNFHLERFYKPAATLEGAPAVLQPRATPPQLAYSHDPDRDGGLLRQDGYVLIGTTSFDGAADLPLADQAVAQGQKVGAAIVLLNVRSYSYSRSVLDGTFYVSADYASCVRPKLLDGRLPAVGTSLHLSLLIGCQQIAPNSPWSRTAYRQQPD
jgi:hypothetical protein